MKCVSGWIKVCRDMRAHPLVGFGQQVKPWDESVKTCYSRAEAWLDLIMSASYADAEVASGRKKVAVTQGQVVAAIRYLSRRWNWSVKAVRGFLDRLENDGMIERQTPDRTVSDELRKRKDANTDVTLLTLCNYSAYQIGCISEGHSEGTARAQR